MVAPESGDAVAYLKLWLQYLAPHHGLTSLAKAVTHWRFRPWKRLLLHAFCKAYRPDLSEAREPDTEAYPDFNAFFVRALRPEARPAPTDSSLVLCPVDGIVSQYGSIRKGELLQAKRMRYRVATLLGDAQSAERFAQGSFITLYLSPAHYHRVHMPLDGELRLTRYLPGRLFSVAPFTVRAVPRLFCRNERLVCLFHTPAGYMAQVLVGAMLVAGIETVWHGGYGHPGCASTHRFEPASVGLARGEEMGRFNYGSTVILLFEKDCIRWRKDLGIGTERLLREPIARVLKAETMIHSIGQK